ncbi:hypothetical protein [Pedobacter sp. SYSU D00535]|uniref:hypothetical protein n=1 Tax=Pedobacter sp. SYSU D00535 TaxID=2810308 RepID=UPI001A972ED9|nr:hypothetical protein [Pedobacter sp. SYSU D00535]
MKKTFLLIGCFLALTTAKAQDFNKHLSTARTSYSSNKLSEARFAMQQMLQELDIMAGKEILKLLPAKLEALNSVTSNDNVSGASGFAGIVIHREYGAGEKKASIDIIGNSPLMASVNAILALPFVGAGGNQKVIKLEGYKALLEKSVDSETNKESYEIKLPLNSSLLTLKADGVTEEEIKKFAAGVPVAQLVKALQ